MQSYKSFITENFKKTGSSKNHTHDYMEFTAEHTSVNHGHSHVIIRNEDGVATGFEEKDGHTHSKAGAEEKVPVAPKETNT